MTTLIRAAAIAACFAFASPAFAHGGGLNRCGCHVNHKTGECHCHRPNGDCSCACSCQRAEGSSIEDGTACVAPKAEKKSEKAPPPVWAEAAKNG